MNEEYIDNVKHLIEQKDADQVKELSPTYPGRHRRIVQRSEPGRSQVRLSTTQ